MEIYGNENKMKQKWILKIDIFNFLVTYTTINNKNQENRF